MKKLSAKARRENIRRAVWGMQSRWRVNQGKLVGVVANVRSSRWIRRGHPRRVSIAVPSRLCATTDHDRDILLGFFESVEARLSQSCFVRLDLRGVKELMPCGTLLFRARLDMWTTQNEGLLSASYPNDDVVEQLFQHIGVTDVLKLRPRKIVDHDHVKYWHYHCGSKMDASIYRELVLSLKGRIDHPERDLFADCLNEAVYNTVNHAYAFEAPGLPEAASRKWWMFSQVKSGRLFVAIYDSGVTIPASLLRRPEWRDYARLRNRDGQLVEAAANSPRTSTKLAHRGKGLPEMLEFTRKLSRGGLTIASRRGVFAYDAAAQKPRRLKLSPALPGTLVLWELPFQEVQVDGKNQGSSQGFLRDSRGTIPQGQSAFWRTIS